MSCQAHVFRPIHDDGHGESDHAPHDCDHASGHEFQQVLVALVKFVTLLMAARLTYLCPFCQFAFIPVSTFRLSSQGYPFIRFCSVHLQLIRGSVIPDPPQTLQKVQL